MSVPLRHAGLALAIGLGRLNAFLLYRILRREGIYVPQPGWPAFILKVVVSVAVMAVVLFLVMGRPVGGWQRAGSSRCLPCSDWSFWGAGLLARASASACVRHSRRAAE